DPSVSAVPAPTTAPVFDSQPPASATAGRPYTYQVAAHDPQNEALSYLLARAPDGMALDPATGLVTWTPTAASPAQAQVVLQAYDALGGHASQAFTVQVAGVNLPPAFDQLPDKVEGQEGQPLTVAVHASDPEGDPLVYWADGLPGGGAFDPDSQTLTWTPDFQSAGTYTVVFTVSDDVHASRCTTTLLTAEGTQVPTLVRPADRTVRQGDPVRVQLQADDPDGDTLTYSSPGLPVGADLNPTTGLFTWTPAYSVEGTVP